MPMPKEAIDAAIDERLTVLWRRRCKEESAAPVCLISIKQLDGPDYSQPVVSCCENMPDDQLADLLLGISRLLRAGRSSGSRRREVREW